MALHTASAILFVFGFSSGDVAVVLTAIAALVAVAVAGYVLIRMTRPRRHRPPRKGVRPSAPPKLSSYRPGGSVEVRPPMNGGTVAASLQMRGGDEAFAIGREPSVIGSSPALCTIVLPGDGIAPEHARIWYRQGKFLLHHVGGLSRKTFVSGQEVDWVVLEPGDEVAIGPHRLVFEESVAVAAGARSVSEGPRRREQNFDDDLSRMEAAVRELWAEGLPASETAVGNRAGTGKFKVHRRKDELAERVGGTWVKQGRTVVLER